MYRIWGRSRIVEHLDLVYLGLVQLEEGSVGKAYRPLVCGVSLLCAVTRRMHGIWRAYWRYLIGKSCGCGGCWYMDAVRELVVRSTIPISARGARLGVD